MAEIRDLGSKRAEKAMEKGGQSSALDKLSLVRERIEEVGEKNVKFMQVILMAEDGKDDFDIFTFIHDKCNPLERVGVYEILRDFIDD